MNVVYKLPLLKLSNCIINFLICLFPLHKMFQTVVFLTAYGVVGSRVSRVNANMKTKLQH